MAMVCPICKRVYKDETQCGRCSVRLQYHGETLSEAELPLHGHWSRRAWGRMGLALLLSQGLYYAVSQLLVASYLFFNLSAESEWHNWYSVIGGQFLQMLALFAGSLFAGAGERKGFLYGGIVGVWNGVLFAVASGQESTVVNFVGQPLINVAFGALGGLSGSWIWKPPALASFAPVQSEAPAPIRRKAGPITLTSTRVHWLRVFAGVAMVVSGVLWTETLVGLTQEATRGAIGLKTALQEQVLAIEIGALAVLAAGLLAGINSWNGSFQGTWVGVLSAGVLAGYSLLYKNPVHYPIGFLVAGVLAVAYIGGVFGGRFFPPVPSEGKSRKLKAA